MLKVKSISALLLVSLAWAANAQLLEPRGDEVENGQGISFSFEHQVTIFGQVLGTDIKHYVYRKIGRVAIGTEAYDPDFEVTKMRNFNYLQPSEVFSARTIESTMKQGRLRTDQLVLLGDAVLNNFWNVETFKPLGGHIITWERQRSGSAPEQTNEFQIAFVYNESSIYVLNNYVRMDFKNADQIMAGFSRRNSFESAYLPFTGNTIGKLANVSGVGNRTLGRFIYRIDSWPPRRGGCLTEDPASPADRTLSSTVTRDSVLGGSLAIVSSRCPEDGVNGTCAIRMGGRVVGQSSTVSCSECRNVFLACPVPPSYREGRAALSLKLSNSDSEYSTEVSFGNPDQVRRQIDLGSADNWMTLSATTRQITYNPAGMRGNLTLHVIGYSELRLNEISVSNTPVRVLLKTPAKSDGQMDLSSLSCPADVPECESHHVGYLEIVDNASPRSLRSGIIPLGWFVNKYFLDKQQNNWHRDRCKSLSSNDAQTEKVRNQLRRLVCPSTIAQAKADTSRYLRLSYCPNLPGGCASATPQQQCFVSRPETNTDTFGVPASVCCYNAASGNMLYQQQLNTGNNNQAWTQHASRSIRSHPDGQPHAETLLPGQVSFMSHWYWDTLPFLYCCRWSNLGECPFYYMHERPTPKLSSYTVGRGSSNVGDPHMSSFSGQSFLFNGYGEYWLLQSDSFQVQGRYVRLGAINNATFLVALSVKIGNGPAFQASILPPPASPRFRIQRRALDNNATDIQLSADYPFTEAGVTIKINNENNIVIQLANNLQSIGIDLYAASAGEFNFINIFIALSATMKGQTRGLLGRWTDDLANEFVTVDNNVVSFRQNASEFHEEFCVKNQLKSVTESLFNYDGNRNNDFDEINRVRRIAYRPIFRDEGLSHGQESSVCEGDRNCLFDIRVTQNVDIARLTASHGREFGLMQRATLNVSVGYCDIPDVQGVQIQPDAILSEGASLTISCAASLRSSRASESIQCRRQSDRTTLKWEPDPATSGFRCTLDDRDAIPASGANIGLIVGITVPLAILLIVLVVIVIVIVRRRSNPSGGGQAGRPKPQQQQQQQRQQQQQQQRPPQKQLQTSTTTIVSNSDSERGGYDNHGQGNRRPPNLTATSDGDDNEGPDASLPRDRQGADAARQSYIEAQMEPLDPVNFNTTEYAEPQRGQQQISKSEVV